MSSTKILKKIDKLLMDGNNKAGLNLLVEYVVNDEKRKNSSEVSQVLDRIARSAEIKEYAKAYKYDDIECFQVSANSVDFNSNNLKEIKKKVQAKKKKKIIAITALIIVIASCIGGYVALQGTPVESIELHSSTDVCDVLTEYQIDAEILPENATDKNIEWSVNNSDVKLTPGDGFVKFTVSQNLTNGDSFEISALNKKSGITNTIVFTVKNDFIFSLSSEVDNLGLGEKIKVYSGIEDKYTATDIDWTSDNANVILTKDGKNVIVSYNNNIHPGDAFNVKAEVKALGLTQNITLTANSSVYIDCDQHDTDYIITSSYDKASIVGHAGFKTDKQILIENRTNSLDILLKDIEIKTNNGKSAIDFVGNSQINITIEGNVKLNGSDGTASVDKTPAITVKNLNIISNGNLIAIGGAGASTEHDGVGQNGASGVACDKITISGTGSVSFIGGTGGQGSMGSDGYAGNNGHSVDKNGSGDNPTSGEIGTNGGTGFKGGNGGVGLEIPSAESLTISGTVSVRLVGGNGGQGGTGGQGGQGGTGGDGRVDSVRNNHNQRDAADGGQGGQGGTGGQGGDGGIGCIYDVSASGAAIITGDGGQGGQGGRGGTGGTGGFGSYRTWQGALHSDSPNKPVAAGGDGGKGGIGGTGGNGGNGTNGGLAGIGGQGGNGGNGGQGGHVIVYWIGSSEDEHGANGSHGVTGTEGSSGTAGLSN